MTLWIVVAAVLVLVLAVMAWSDRRAAARGARVRGDIGTATRHNPALGNPEAYRGGAENAAGGGS
jgi:hypothetical protein